MAEQWYYTTGGQQHGPIDTHALRSLIAAGQVAPCDVAWHDGMAEWTAVSMLKELSGPAASPVIPSSPSPVIPGPVAQLEYGGYAPQDWSAMGGIQTGGFWIRVGAYIIDYLLLAIPGQLISVFFNEGVTPPAPGTPPSLSQLSVPLTVLGFTFALNWLYFAMMESSPLQATLGKMALGLVITDSRGQRISFARATGRYFGKLLSSLILCIGYILVAFDLQNRALHDMLAGTLVVRKRSMQQAAMA